MRWISIESHKQRRNKVYLNNAQYRVVHLHEEKRVTFTRRIKDIISKKKKKKKKKKKNKKKKKKKNIILITTKWLPSPSTKE